MLLFCLLFPLSYEAILSKADVLLSLSFHRRSTHVREIDKPIRYSGYQTSKMLTSYQMRLPASHWENLPKLLTEILLPLLPVHLRNWLPNMRSLP